MNKNYIDNSWLSKSMIGTVRTIVAFISVVLLFFNFIAVIIAVQVFSNTKQFHDNVLFAILMTLPLFFGFCFFLRIYIKYLRIPHRENIIINNGVILDGEIVKFAAIKTSSGQHSDHTRINPQTSYRAYYKFVVDNVVIYKKSPYYFSRNDKKEIENNNNKVKIALFGKKSCICNFKNDINESKENSIIVDDYTTDNLQLEKFGIKEVRKNRIIGLVLYSLLYLPFAIFWGRGLFVGEYWFFQYAVNECVAISLLAFLTICFLYLGVKLVDNLMTIKRENQIIANGVYVYGEVKKFKQQFMSLNMGYVNDTKKVDDDGFSHPGGNFRAIYVYEYSGKTYKKKSPRYFTENDCKVIMKNNNRIKIAILGKKSCILGK